MSLQSDGKKNDRLWQF